MRTETDEPATGFKFTAPSPFQLRNYADEKLEDLKPVHELVDSILENHKALIPGSMNRLMRQWREDLWRAIEAITSKDAEQEQQA